MNAERLSWEEIKKQYPKQWVVLDKIETGNNSMDIVSAVVKYNEDVLGFDLVAIKAFEENLKLIHTAYDEGFDMGVLTW